MLVRLMWITQWIVAHLPVGLGNFIADRGGDLAHMLAARSRCIAESNMRHVLPEGTPDKVIRAKVRGVFRNLGRNYYDLLRSHSMSDAKLDKIIEFDEESWKPVKEYLDQKTGVLMVSAHFGAFDIVSTVLARRGMPLLMIVERIRPYKLSDFLTRLRTERGLRVANLEEGLGAVKRSLQALRNGEMVGLFADRNIEKTGITIPFFGEEAVMAAGMAKMAVRSKVPVVAAFCHRLGRRYVVEFEPPMFPPTEGSEEQRLTSFTRTIFSLYEKHIAKDPEQWVLLQPVWPDAPCAAAAEPAQQAAA